MLSRCCGGRLLARRDVRDVGLRGRATAAGPQRAAVGLLVLTLTPAIAPVSAAPVDSPTAAPATVRLDPQRSLGSARARVGIVEFSDIRCPFCRRFHENTFPELKRRYIDTGKVRYFRRDRTRGGDREGQRAAASARCAGRQGAYWPMLDALFSRQRELGLALYTTLAAELRLDRAAFRTCLTGGQEGEGVRVDGRYADDLQVDAVPTFFVGRLSGTRLLSPTRVVGARSAESLQTIIEERLRP